MLEYKEFILNLIQNYGYIGLFLLFVIDTVGVFLPSKTILMLTGFLVSQGYIKHIPLFFTALTGSLTGFLIGYIIGLKIGKPFLEKHGKYMRLTPELLGKAEKWFARYGTAAILIAYFIPGLRHIVPYLSGIAQMPARKVMLFAFTGAALWILTFTSIGRFVGNNWSVVKSVISDYALEAGGVAVMVVLLAFLIRQNLRKNHYNKRV